MQTYPRSINLNRDKLATAIETLTACAQACTACADACLSESSIADLTKCIRINLDCADICAGTARVLSRHTGYDANISRTLLQACATACRACGDECAEHAEMHTNTAASAPRPAVPARKRAGSCSRP
jgi:hypothetical protein